MRTIDPARRVHTVWEPRTDDEWAWAEGQRGLFMVETLSTAWGHLSSAPWADLGTHVWAEFPIPPEAPTPQHLAAYVFTELTQAPGPLVHDVLGADLLPAHERRNIEPNPWSWSTLYPVNGSPASLSVNSSMKSRPSNHSQRILRGGHACSTHGGGISGLWMPPFQGRRY